MTADPRPQLAQRIHLGLMRELGQGIDVRQMLDDPLYARDVLLVCQAYPGTELHALGAAFGRNRPPTPTTAPAKAPARRPPTLSLDSSDFGGSQAPATASSAFDDYFDSAQDPRHGLRRWLTPSTWFAR